MPIHFRSGQRARNLLLQLSAPYRALRTAPSFEGQTEGEGHHRQRRSHADAEEPNSGHRAVAGARWSSGVQCDDVGEFQLLVPRRPEHATGITSDDDDDDDDDDEFSDDVVEVRVAEDATTGCVLISLHLPPRDQVRLMLHNTTRTNFVVRQVHAPAGTRPLRLKPGAGGRAVFCMHVLTAAPSLPHRAPLGLALIRLDCLPHQSSPGLGTHTP